MLTPLITAVMIVSTRKRPFYRKKEGKTKPTGSRLIETSGARRGYQHENHTYQGSRQFSKNFPGNNAHRRCFRAGIPRMNLSAKNGWTNLRPLGRQDFRPKASGAASSP